MIISRREEETAADCQGLVGDLVIFSSMLSEQTRECVCPRSDGEIWKREKDLTHKQQGNHLLSNKSRLWFAASRIATTDFTKQSNGPQRLTKYESATQTKHAKRHDEIDELQLGGPNPNDGTMWKRGRDGGRKTSRCSEP